MRTAARGAAAGPPPPGGVGPAHRTCAPLDHLAELMRAHPPAHVPGLPRFTGGAVGFMGYDVARTLERLARSAAR